MSNKDFFKGPVEVSITSQVKIPVQETYSSRMDRTLKNRFPQELRVATVLLSPKVYITSLWPCFC